MNPFGKKRKLRPWCPDFKQNEGLPDIKVVRTGFLINFVIIVIGLILITVTVYRETVAAAAQASLRQFEQQREELEPENRRILELNRSFIEARPVLGEVQRFSAVPFYVDELLHAIGETKPEAISIEHISYQVQPVQTRRDTRRRHVVLLRARARTIPEPINAFKNALADLPILAELGAEIRDTNPERTAGGTFSFSLRLEVILTEP